MIVKKTQADGTLIYVNAFTGKKVNFKRVKNGNPSNERLAQLMAQRQKGFIREKTKNEKTLDRNSFFVQELYRQFKTLGTKKYNKNRFILSCKRCNVNPYQFI